MSRGWLEWLTRRRLVELSVGLALGSAAASLADRVSDVVVQMLAQNAGRNPFPDAGQGGAVLGLANVVSAPYFLNFRVGGTLIIYGDALSAALALALLAGAGWLLIRHAERALTPCRFCAARIPHSATRCAICGSTLETAEQ
jgi:large-conductance mechanosensitive channel